MIDINSEIKNAWIRQIREDWRNVNFTNFRDRMRLPNIDLINSNTNLGKWEGGSKRKLSMSINMIQNRPWQDVQEILYHEMAHQFVEEILKITNDAPHGETFKKVCYENGFDHRASEKVFERLNGNCKAANLQSENHKILNKVQKLLSLAQSQNRFEAESAMSKAQELLLRHNLSLLEAETNRNYVHKQIGEIGVRNPIKSLVGTIITTFFFVEALWVSCYDPKKNKKGRILEIYGTPENVEMAEYVHSYLFNISELLWKEYKGNKNIAGNRHRRTYIYGLLNGFYKKLDSQNEENRKKSLVWTGDPELKRFYRRRNRKIRKSAFSYSSSCKDAYNSGVSRGKNLVIHKGIKTGGSGEVRLLS